MPSHNESFGLVALEAQACGTPVVAAAVGGLVTAVRDGVSGALVDGHDPADWARVLGGLLAEPGRRAELAPGRGRARPGTSPGTAPPPACSTVYRDAVVAHRADRQRAASLDRADRFGGLMLPPEVAAIIESTLRRSRRRSGNAARAARTW